MPRGAKLRSGFNLGGEAAEADGLLEDAFIESGDYQELVSRDNRRCLLVGRTGAGKSAALRHIQDTFPEHTIRINPENLSLPYITNLQAIRYLDSLEINLDVFWHALWRHVLLVEILKHRYKVTSPVAKANFLQTLRAKLQSDRTKQAALAYLEQFEGRFWCESDERVREITDRFAERISTAAGGKIGVPGTSVGAAAGLETELSQESRAEQVARFQRIANETQLARLNTMIEVLDEDILDSAHHYTYVIIDDLDKEWVDERIANDLIRCLFQTVYSLQHVRNLKVIVALRTNIFQELDFGRKGGGQEEKFRALVLDMRWTPASLTEILDERTRVAAERASMAVSSFAELLPHSNDTMGRPLEYILERTLLRPRDALAFANECLKTAAGKARLAWADIKTAERAYSVGRVLALRDEWKGTYPGISAVIDKFRRGSFRMEQGEMQARLEEIVLLLADDTFEGVGWLTDASAGVWSSGSDDGWAEIYQPLIKILYRVGLVGLSSQHSAAAIFFNDSPLYVDDARNIARARYFYVHRTYQQGLDMTQGSRQDAVD